MLKFLEHKKQEEIEQKRKAMLDFVGEFGDGNTLANKSHQEIKAKKYE